MTDAIHPATDVPEDSEGIPCPYCERPFASGAQRDLHVGEVHADAMDDEEGQAYDSAREAETDAMWIYHFKVVVVLLLLYFLTGLLYLLVLG